MEETDLRRVEELAKTTSVEMITDPPEKNY
jgi:hypothetical protein